MRMRKFQVKISIFAVDLTTFVMNRRSFVKLKNLLSMFGNISGLKLNDEKTEAYQLGSSHDAPEDLGMNKVNKQIKILGIIFTYDWKLCIQFNYQREKISGAPRAREQSPIPK